MRALLAFLICSAVLRAEFSYRSRIQITGGELYDTLAAAGAHGRDPVIVTKLIKGFKMAVLAPKHTTIIDEGAGTITEIDFAKKTYYEIPFAQVAKTLAEAAAKSPHETSFKISPSAPAASAKLIGIMNSVETAFKITGASSGLNVDLDAWVGTIPGYEQMASFNDRLAAKIGPLAGYAFAAGWTDLALRAPESLQGFEAAAKQLNRSLGAPLKTAIAIKAPDRTIAKATVELSDFGGGVQDATQFVPPSGFKKGDPPPVH